MLKVKQPLIKMLMEIKKDKEKEKKIGNKY